MFSRYGLLVAALGLVALLNSGQAQEQTQTPDNSANSQQQPSNATPFRIPVEIFENEAESETRQRHEADARQREIDDLLAQQGMNAATQEINLATQDMRDYSYRQTWLIGIGTVLLVATLLLTLGANRAAVKAAVAAERAVDVTRIMGEAQTRAYLTVTGATIDYKGPTAIPHIRIGIENTGNSPALGVVLAFKVQDHKSAFDLGRDGCLNEPIQQYPVARIIGARVKDNFDVSFPDMPANPDQVAHPKPYFLRLEAVVEYNSVFTRRDGPKDRDTVCVLFRSTRPEVDLSPRQLAFAKVMEMKFMQMAVPLWANSYRGIMEANERGYNQERDS